MTFSTGDDSVPEQFAYFDLLHPVSLISDKRCTSTHAHSPEIRTRDYGVTFGESMSFFNVWR